MGPIQSFAEFVAFMRRRFVPIAIIVAVGSILSIAYALQQRHIYEVTAVVQLETAKIAESLAPNTVATSAARRLQTVEQQVMARDNLLEIINRHGLYAGTAFTDLEKVSALRNSTWLNWIESADATAPRPRQVSGFSITLQADGAQRAVDILNDIIDQMVALEKEDRLERTRTTIAFFTERETALLQEIEALQDRVAALKAENDLTVAGGVEFRRIEIGSVQEALLEIEREQLALQGELDKLESEPRLRVTERRMEEIAAQIASLDAQSDRLQERSASLAEGLETLPGLQQQVDLYEEQLAELQRQHTMALQARADSETAHRLEMNDQSERLNIIERPLLPDYPVAPSRKKIAAQGILASMVLAFGLAFLLELRTPAIRTAVQMEREVGLRPVVEIPHFASPLELARPTAARWVALLVFVVALLVGVSTFGGVL